MRVPIVIAIILALLALMACVLQTPEVEETSGSLRRAEPAATAAPANG